MKLGFVGLGVMGGPMAGHLADAGGDVVVWNRTKSKAEQLRDKGVSLAGSLAELAAQCDVICLCVSRTEDVRACIDEMTPHAKPGTLFIDHSTIAPQGAIQIAQDLKSKGFRFVDAPIT